jgi:hypothetical protein
MVNVKSTCAEVVGSPLCLYNILPDYCQMGELK